MSMERYCTYFEVIETQLLIESIEQAINFV